MAKGFSESTYFGMLTEAPVSRPGSGGIPVVWFKLLTMDRFIQADEDVTESLTLFCRCTGYLAPMMLQRNPREMLLVTGRVRPSLLKRSAPSLPLDVTDVHVLCRPQPTPLPGRLT